MICQGFFDPIMFFNEEIHQLDLKRKTLPEEKPQKLTNRFDLQNIKDSFNKKL